VISWDPPPVEAIWAASVAGHAVDRAATVVVTDGLLVVAVTGRAVVLVRGGAVVVVVAMAGSVVETTTVDEVVVPSATLRVRARLQPATMTATATTPRYRRRGRPNRIAARPYREGMRASHGHGSGDRPLLLLLVLLLATAAATACRGSTSRPGAIASRRPTTVPLTAATAATTVAPTTTTSTSAPSAATTAPTSTASPTSTAVPSTAAPSTAPTAGSGTFVGTVAAVGASDLPFSWHAGCPVGPTQLRLLHLSYWGFDNQPHVGTMVVNAAVTSDVLKVFARLFAEHFPIHQMQPVDAFRGSDPDSMAADNTSGFNCRNAVAPGPPQWSVHAYGEAIDVNTVENPYVTGATVMPPAGAAYVNRTSYRPGMAVAGGQLVQAFASVGWPWGGRWSSPDYQHFSKTGG
jgi:hypothetical protein